MRMQGSFATVLISFERIESSFERIQGSFEKRWGTGRQAERLVTNLVQISG